MADLEEEAGTLIVRLLLRAIGCLEEGRESFGGGFYDLDLAVVVYGDLDLQRRGILDCLVEEGMLDHELSWGYLVLKEDTVLGCPDTHDCPYQGIVVVEGHQVAWDMPLVGISRYLVMEQVDDLSGALDLDYIA